MDTVQGLTGTAPAFGDTSTPNPTTVTVTLPAVVGWAAGRGTPGVTATGTGTTEGTPAAPKWI